MANDRDSLLREVDEELRREQFQKLWQKYNGLIIGVAALIIAGVAGYQVLESRRIQSAEAAGAEFEAATRATANGQPDDARKAFEKLAESGPHGYAALARLHLAGAHAAAGRTAEALALFESLGKDGSADPMLRNFAELQAASLRLGSADFTEMQNRLTPLAGDGKPFSASARELLGVAAFRSGNLAEARKQLEPLLIDPASSRSVQDRIKIVMARIAEAELASMPEQVPPSTSSPDAKQ